MKPRIVLTPARQPEVDLDLLDWLALGAIFVVLTYPAVGLLVGWSAAS